MSHLETDFSFINPWLENLNYDWKSLYELGTPISFPKNETIFNQNDPGDFIYIVKKGRIRLSLISQNGEEKALTIVGVHGLLGECSLNNEMKYSTNAISSSKCDLVKVERQTFMTHLHKHPETYTSLLDLITKKYQVLCMQSMELSYAKAFTRVCATFIHLAREYGESQKEKEVKLTISFTHQEMANLLGITRVTIANNIKWLLNESYIRKEGKHYVITDIDALIDLSYY
ncbi:Crp/Fnr family transcriptional regulator [Halalkalibacillus halophilus]|uniref:Crp/Fnr family transcriptional regulator n=1 Tax=Halalkalibacillus halophilus TaxID=392827 RepID=UPI0004176923|nr:Crp/Fnr family transcriptional regulator [Halalkalibacillus halophilus]